MTVVYSCGWVELNSAAIFQVQLGNYLYLLLFRVKIAFKFENIQCDQPNIPGKLKPSQFSSYYFGAIQLLLNTVYDTWLCYESRDYLVQIPFVIKVTL